MSKHFYLNPEEALPQFAAGISQRVGRIDGTGLRVCLAAGRFNIGLVGPMLDAAVQELLGAGVQESDIEICWVPGSFELPFALSRLLATGSFDAALACGVVIDGATQHAHHIMSSISSSLNHLAMQYQLPVLDAVVSAPSIDLAEQRCLTGKESRGAYAARAALECATLWKNG